MNFFRIFSFLIIGAVSAFHFKSQAQTLQCKELFARSHNEAKKVDYTGVSLFYSPEILINGRPGQDEFTVLIEVSRPNAVNPSKQFVERYLDPVSGLPLPYGGTYSHKPGLQAIYESYGDRVDPEIVKTVIRVESQLPKCRQSTFLASSFDTKINKAYGFIRIFDGSIYNDGIRARVNSHLPLERILKEMNKSTDIVNEKKQQGAYVYEIGKYFIKDHLDATDTRHIKSDIINFLIYFLKSRSRVERNDSYYFAHVASATHRIAYQRFFGFEVVDKSKSQGLAEGEDILIIKGQTLLENIEKRLVELKKNP